MNLLADESVDRSIVERLRADRHAVRYVAEDEPGMADDDVLSQANGLGALLITADADFGELVFRLGQAHAGVVLVRLAGLSAQAKAETVSGVFAKHENALPSTFSVVSPGRVRIRRATD